MKRIISFCMAIFLAILPLSGCSQNPKHTKFQMQFFDTFDTLIQIVGFAATQEEFEVYSEQAHERFIELHALFDRFEDYGENGGIAHINSNAGIAPVNVDPVVMELILLGTEGYEQTDGMVDITAGALTDLWQGYISRYGASDNAQIELPLPSAAELDAAEKLCGMDKLIIDNAAQTVYLTEKGVLLDVGAIAKGFATEIVTQELVEAGFESFSISSGGNVRTVGRQSDDNTLWGVGIQNPFDGAILGNDSSLLDVAYVVDTSVVTSGDYQRYYMSGEQRIHHIIDPITKMPGENYRSVTVISEHSGWADLLSTAIYLMDYETGAAFALEREIGVMWVMPDGDVVTNEYITKFLRDRGGAKP